MSRTTIPGGPLPLTNPFRPALCHRAHRAGRQTVIRASSPHDDLSTVVYPVGRSSLPRRDGGRPALLALQMGKGRNDPRLGNNEMEGGR